MRNRVRRAAALALVAVTAALTVGVVSAPAQAMPPGPGWYRCHIPDYGWMWCLDV
ncbi:hypothetical protein [Nonomuraea sp. MG754425]|uniref:hypothetical protein n=1 Tax=Nonomuraea sp. MG754425 TaxID=2570319 RepID=UPI001F2B4E7E|nr:hypothetical protein [Nonomuraea sp. MG754425]